MNNLTWKDKLGIAAGGVVVITLFVSFVGAMWWYSDTGRECRHYYARTDHSLVFKALLCLGVFEIDRPEAPSDPGPRKELNR
jgi:hypothetical protein